MLLGGHLDKEEGKRNNADDVVEEYDFGTDRWDVSQNKLPVALP